MIEVKLVKAQRIGQDGQVFSNLVASNGLTTNHVYLIDTDLASIEPLKRLSLHSDWMPAARNSVCFLHFQLQDSVEAVHL